MTLAATILKQDLKQFCGTDRYYYDPLFKNINYTDGFRYFMHNAGEGAHWFLTLVATEIRPILEEDFYFIELVVSADETAKITVQRDIGEPVLYEKEFNGNSSKKNIVTELKNSTESFKGRLKQTKKRSDLCFYLRSGKFQFPL